MTVLVIQYSLENRCAKIYQDTDGYFVECWEDEQAVKQIDVRDHSMHYAEDVAENWITGIIKE